MGWLSINKWFCFLVIYYNKLNIKQIIQSGTFFVCGIGSIVLCACWLFLRHPLFSPFNSIFKHITWLGGAQHFWRHNSCAIFWTHGREPISIELFIYFLTRSVITTIIWVIMSKSYNCRCNLSLANPSMSVTLLNIKWILSQKGVWVCFFTFLNGIITANWIFFPVCVKKKKQTKI